MPKKKNESLKGLFADLRESANKISVPDAERKIPSILEFVEDPEYLGLPHSPTNPIILFPMQRLVLKAFYRGSEGNEHLEFDQDELDMLRAAGLDIAVKFNGEVRLGDPKNWRADVKKLALMGFKPTQTLNDGLEKYAGLALLQYALDLLVHDAKIGDRTLELGFHEFGAPASFRKPRIALGERRLDIRAQVAQRAPGECQHQHRGQGDHHEAIGEQFPGGQGAESVVRQGVHREERNSGTQWGDGKDGQQYPAHHVGCAGCDLVWGRHHDGRLGQEPGETCFRTFSRSLPDKGLTSQPVAPRRFASSRLATAPSVVSVRMGEKRNEV